jgi:hypothetical protein
MLACNLLTPISLGSIFLDDDLKDTGIELDSHITILYAPNKLINKAEVLKRIGQRNVIYLHELIQSENYPPVFSLFELSSFSNESDYVVLKLKKETELYQKLKWLNSDLSKSYKVTSEFGEYKPHLTLAELKPGTAGKYLKSDLLQRVLRDSAFQPEDFVISYSFGDSKDFIQHDLTHNRSVDRVFRIRDLQRDIDCLKDE